MDPDWALYQACQSVQSALERLTESAARSTVHKQRCQEVAEAAEKACWHWSAAFNQRHSDHGVLLTAAARLCAALERSRACVESLGNPLTIAARLAATMRRKSAERMLADERRVLQELFAESSFSMPGAGPASLRVATLQSGLISPHSVQRAATAAPSSAAGFLSRRGPASFAQGSDWQRTIEPGSLPLSPSSTIRSRFNGSPTGPTRGSPPLSARRGDAPESVISPTARDMDGLDGRGLPFAQRTVRASDNNNPVQRLCFMRGAGGEEAAVQLMVVMPKHMEIYSAALDSFCSATPLENDGQAVTSSALYEPTVDLITGHKCGSVLVYGRTGWAPTSASNGGSGGAGQTLCPSTMAGLPLVIRLSRFAVTALHCVPAIELDATNPNAGNNIKTCSTAGSSCGAAAVAAAAAEGGDNTGGPGGASAAPPPAPAAPSCTIDDVLLFTGDASGRVMAVRYSRVQPEVLAATVFTAAARRTAAAAANANNPSNRTPPTSPPAAASSPSAQTAPGASPAAASDAANNSANTGGGGNGVVSNPNPEITGLLYRSGYLIISTSQDMMHSVRVTSAGVSMVAAGSATSGRYSAAAAAGTAAGSDGGARGQVASTEAADKLAPLAVAPVNTTARPGSSSLRPSTSVSLLSPTASAIPTRAGGMSALRSAATSESVGGAASGTSAGGGASAGGGGPAAGNSPAGGGNPDTGIRRGTLQLVTSVVDTFSFSLFGGCTAMVALDWGLPESQAAASCDVGTSGACAAGPTSAFAGAASAIVAAAPRSEADAAGANFFTAAGECPPGPWATTPYGTPPLTTRPSSASTTAAAGRGGPRVVSPRRGMWRMLTAHTNGQLLMWDLTSGRLHVICSIGDPGPPIVSVFLFPDVGTMVELQSSGHIRVGPLPSCSLATPINPLGGIPVWRLRQARLRAHHGRLTSGAALANCIATGSKAGGVKVWSAMDLRRRAASQGVSFLAPPVAAGGGGMAAAGTAAAAARSAAQTAAGSPTISSRSPLCLPYQAVMVTPVRPGAAGGSVGGAGSEDRYPLGPGAAPPPLSGPEALANTAPPHGHYPPTSAAAAAALQMSYYHPHNSAHNQLPPALTMGVPPMGLPNGGGGPVGLPYLSPTEPFTPHTYGSGMPSPYISGGGGPAASAMVQHVPGAELQSAAAPAATVAAAIAHISGPRGSGGGGAPGTTPFGLGTVSLDSPAGSLKTAAVVGGNEIGPGEEDPHALVESVSRRSSFRSTRGNPQGGQQQQQATQQQQQRTGQMTPPDRPATGSGLAPPRTERERRHDNSRPASTHRLASNPVADAVDRAFAQMAGGAAGDSGTVSKRDADSSAHLPFVAPAGVNMDGDGMDSVSRSDPRDTWARSPPPTHMPVEAHMSRLGRSDTRSSTATNGGAGGCGGPSLLMSPGSPRHTVLEGGLAQNAAEMYGNGFGGSITQSPLPPGVGPGSPYPHLGNGWAATHPYGHPQQYSHLQSPSPHQQYHAPPSPPPQPPSVKISPPYGLPAVQTSDRGGYSCSLGPQEYPPRASEYGSASSSYPPQHQHVPGPAVASSPRGPRQQQQHQQHQESLRRLSTPADYSGLSQGMDTDPMLLPLPPIPSAVPIPVLPPPAPDPNAAPRSSMTNQVNPLLQNCFIPPNDLRLIDPVGEGAEGTVWRGRWHHIDVAVKEMHPTSPSFGQLASIAKDLSCPDSAGQSQVITSVVKEVSALIDLGQHPNIMRFVGVCIAPPRIITEYYKMGSLFSMLKDARRGNMRTREKLTWETRLTMLQDIAAGMAYLHSRSYIHGDLRSPNVFVTEDQRLKIGDFGFARILSVGGSNNMGAGDQGGVPARLTNPRWQAPEVYAMTDPTATTAADVYSFGIIMYELLTFRQPYDDVADDEMVMCRHMLHPAWRPQMPEDAKLPMPRDAHLLEGYKRLMLNCWAENPAKRPGFYKVAERLMALIRWHRVIVYLRKTRPVFGSRHPKAAVPSLPASTATASVATATTNVEVGTTSSAVDSGSAISDALEEAVAKVFELPPDQDMDRELLKAVMGNLGQVQPPAPPPPAAAAAAVAAAAVVVGAAVEKQLATQAAIAGLTPPGTANSSSAVADNRSVAPKPQPPPPPAAASPGAADPPPNPVPIILAYAMVEPTLETAPTLASSGSRPLHVPAASAPPSSPVGSVKTAVVAKAAAGPVAPATSAPPVLGTVADGYGLLTPFKAIGNLSDDEEEDGDGDGDGSPVLPGPPAVAAPAAPPAPPASPAAVSYGTIKAATAAASASGSAAAAVAAANGFSTPAALKVTLTPGPPAKTTSLGVTAPSPSDPFSMFSPFKAVGSLEDDSDDETTARTPAGATTATATATAARANGAAAAKAPAATATTSTTTTTATAGSVEEPPPLVSVKHPLGSASSVNYMVVPPLQQQQQQQQQQQAQPQRATAAAAGRDASGNSAVAQATTSPGGRSAAASTATSSPTLASLASLALSTPAAASGALAMPGSVALNSPAAAAAALSRTAVAARGTLSATSAASQSAVVSAGSRTAGSRSATAVLSTSTETRPAAGRPSFGPASHDPFAMLSPFHSVALDEEDEDEDGGDE